MDLIAEKADLIFFVGSLIFLVALIPSLSSADKPNVWTSLMTGSVLVTFSIVYMSLEFYRSAIITFITALVWFALAIQKGYK